MENTLNKFVSIFTLLHIYLNFPNHVHKRCYHRKVEVIKIFNTTVLNLKSHFLFELFEHRSVSIDVLCQKFAMTEKYKKGIQGIATISASENTPNCEYFSH